MRGGHGGGGGHRGPAPRMRSVGVRHPGGRLPIYRGPGWFWNGVYWVNPQGLCYKLDAAGELVLVDCTASAEGTGGTMDSSQYDNEPGVGGTMDSSSAEGKVREGGPLNIENLRDFLLGVGIGVIALYAYKKYSK